MTKPTIVANPVTTITITAITQIGRLDVWANGVEVCVGNVDFTASVFWTGIALGAEVVSETVWVVIVVVVIGNTEVVIGGVVCVGVDTGVIVGIGIGVVVGVVGIGVGAITP